MDFANYIQMITPQNTIRVTVQLSLKEYRSICLYLTYTSPTIITIFLVLAIMIVSQVIKQDWGFITFFLIILTIYLPFGFYKQADRNYQLTKALHEPVTYEFSADGLIATGASFELKMKWSAINNVRELDKWFLLYESPQNAMLVPKAAFKTEEEIDLFRALIKASTAKS